MNGAIKTDEKGRWLKGNPPGPGRPPGMKDKKWSSLDYWFGLVEKEWDKLKPERRATIAIDAWKALLARKQMPMTPEESVSNADAAMKLLKVLEDASANVARNQRSDTDRMENGTAEIQTEGPTT